MDITKKIHNQLRFQGFSFVLLVLVITGLLIQLSHQYNIEFDWTATGRHSLNAASIKIAEKIAAPLKITSYATSDANGDIRERIHKLIKRYQKINNKIELEFIDPLLFPQKIQELGIRQNGEMIISYQGRSENLQDLTEKGVTNTIQRLLRNRDRHILFVTGHGERSPIGQANHDLGIFGENLSNKGFNIAPLDITKSTAIPDNTSVLVIASPQVDYLPGETEIIKNYVAAGGNLLWFIEPTKESYLSPLATYLNISITKGIIIDPDMAAMGNSATVVLGQYLPHAITENIQQLQLQTLYPNVIGIDITAQDGWTVEPVLHSLPRSWLETGDLNGTVEPNPGQDKEGPITFAHAMTRNVPENSTKAVNTEGTSPTADNPEKIQRIVVIGDGDFLSNTFLGTQGNMAIGESIFNWLAHDDNFIDIPAAIAPDGKITAGPYQIIVIGLLIMIVLPVLLIISGLVIWLKRRKK